MPVNEVGVRSVEEIGKHDIHSPVWKENDVEVGEHSVASRATKNYVNWTEVYSDIVQVL